MTIAAVFKVVTIQAHSICMWTTLLIGRLKGRRVTGLTFT